MNARVQLYTLGMMAIVFVSAGCSAPTTSTSIPTATSVPPTAIPIPPTTTLTLSTTTPTLTTRPTLSAGARTVQAYSTSFAATPPAAPTNTPRPPTVAPECTPSDQYLYVYYPGRLLVRSPCIRVTGIVKSISQRGEGDGDFTFEVALDSPFERYLNDENRKQWRGNLHVEIVCFNPSQGYSKGVCDNFPESLRVVPPDVGQHIWLEGPWVLDMGHTGWAELHPLYRWGTLK
jgi:hypothetical protein